MGALHVSSTPAVAAIRSAVLRAFPNSQLISLGVCNRRYIAGTKVWSQHSWCNAWDISVPAAAGINVRYAVLDQVAAFLRREKTAGRLPVGAILWRIPAHYDHIHVDGSPKRTGTPPLTPATHQERKPAMDVIAELGASGEWVKPFQVAINAAIERNSIGVPPLVVDGRYGNLTRAAVVAYQTGGGLIGLTGTVEGAIDTRTGLLLGRYMR